MSEEVPRYPHFGFFPALPLAKNVELGDWAVGKPPENVPWRSARFKSLAELLLASFDQIGFENAAMLWHRERGFDGALPSDVEIVAIQAAIRFAVLDANDHLFRDLNAGYYIATAENAELFLQPIVEEDGSIAYRRGGALKSVLTGGLKIGEETIPLPDATVAILRPTMISAKLAAAVFHALITGVSKSEHIRIALEWHRVAMSNPNAVTLQQRIIAIKTAFEALFGTSESRECARSLRALFESTTASHLRLLPWAGVLWSPNERKDLVRQYTTKGNKTKSDTRSELEDWFMTLAAARNSIIHDGVLSIIEHEAPVERPLSRYKGQLLWIGERLLREAIKASLGVEVLLCAQLEEEKAWAEFAKSFTAENPELAAPPVTDDVPKEEPPQVEETAAPPSRTVEELVLALGCKAANEIELERASSAPSACDDDDDGENASSVQGKWWCASVGGKSLRISEHERVLLEAAGAEKALPNHFRICD